MASLRTLTFFAWSLTLSLLVLKVHSNNSGTVQSQCPENNKCMTTSGCSLSHHRRAGSNPHLGQVSPIRHSLQHYRGLVQEFRLVLLAYIEIVLNVSRAWNEEDVRVSVLEYGLRNLYPLNNQTEELYTSAGPEDEHRILRESRWLLTSAEAHVQLLHAINYTRTDVFHSLERIARHRSVSFAHLLTHFHVTGLPAQATCVRTSVAETASQINRERFTNMALRDIHQALVRIYTVLSPCEVQWLDEGLHRPKLNCSEASVFYSTMPQGLRFLYNYTEVLVPYENSLSSTM